MASELGQAYVQIIPSAKGISGAISKELGGAAEPAGKSAGGRLGGAIKGALATAGIGAALSKTLGEGADLEQSVGGIETLFKDSAGKMKEYASQAYQTAGVSANTYMETVTSFSASLLQSLGGDTAKAAFWIGSYACTLYPSTSVPIAGNSLPPTLIIWRTCAAIASSSMPGDRFSPRNIGNRFNPATPPASASLRIISSVRFLGCLHNARQLECDATTGPSVHSRISRKDWSDA